MNSGWCGPILSFRKIQPFSMGFLWDFYGHFLGIEFKLFTVILEKLNNFCQVYTYTLYDTLIGKCIFRWKWVAKKLCASFPSHDIKFQLIQHHSAKYIISPCSRLWTCLQRFWNWYDQIIILPQTFIIWKIWSKYSSFDSTIFVYIDSSLHKCQHFFGIFCSTQFDVSISNRTVENLNMFSENNNLYWSGNIPVLHSHLVFTSVNKLIYHTVTGIILIRKFLVLVCLFLQGVAK